ncbi:SET domain-containing protein, partial [Obba rivulosa]
RVQAAGAHAGGLGMFATADLGVGDLIVCERPIVVAPQLLPVPRGPDGKAAHDMYDMGMSYQLGPERTDAYFALSNCFGKPLSQFHGILNTNSLPVGALPGHDGACLAVFKEISRVNHSCRPNAVYSWHLTSFTGQLRALRPIKSGEQVFVTYLGFDQPRANRQQEVLEKYKFKCRCGACTLSGTYARFSDLRRTLILAQAHADLTRTDADVLAWAANPTLPDRMLVDAAELWLSWMVGERSMNDVLLRVIFSRLCKVYAALEDEEAVRKYAKQAAALETAFTGGDGGWRAVAAAPRNNIWWGLRRKA